MYHNYATAVREKHLPKLGNVFFRDKSSFELRANGKQLKVPRSNSVLGTKGISLDFMCEKKAPD